MKRILVALMVTMVATAVAAPPCWACSCAPSTKKEKAKNAQVIFTGKALKVERPGEEPKLKVRFRVKKVYKGNVKRFTNVFTADSGAACGATFKEGETYTVFARWSDGKKWTNSCSGTKKGAINPDNYGLGQGYAPKD